MNNWINNGKNYYSEDTDWSKNKINELKKHSSKNIDFPYIIYEWILYDVDINIYGDSVCELCGKTNLIYEIFIKNRYTKEKMLIGSTCIELFHQKANELTVQGNSGLVQLNKKEMRQHLKKLFQHRYLQWLQDISFNFEEDKFFLDYLYKKIINDDKLSPETAIKFLDKANKYFKNLNIPQIDKHLKKIGKSLNINLQKKESRNQIYKLKDSKYLKYILSSEQLKKYGLQ